MAETHEKIEPYAHLLGEVADAKVAEMAGVTEADVAAFREATAEPSAATAPAAKSKPKPKPASKPAEPAPAYDDNARTAALADAAEALLAQGWSFVDGELVPPAARAATGPELVVRLKAGLRLKGRGTNGKEVSIPLARSLYRGAMAQRVLDLVGHDSDLVEVISG